MNGVTEFRKEVTDIGISEQFTTLVHMNILALTGRRVLIEEVSKPLEGRGFGLPCITILNTIEVVGNKDPCSFTIEPFKVLSAL